MQHHGLPETCGICSLHLNLFCFFMMLCRIISTVFGCIPGALLVQVLIGQHFYIRYLPRVSLTYLRVSSYVTFKCQWRGTCMSLFRLHSSTGVGLLPALGWYFDEPLLSEALQRRRRLPTLHVGCWVAVQRGQAAWQALGSVEAGPRWLRLLSPCS